MTCGEKGKKVPNKIRTHDLPPAEHCSTGTFAVSKGRLCAI